MISEKSERQWVTLHADPLPARLLADHKQMSVILAVDLSVLRDRERSVCRTQSFQQEELLLPLGEDAVMCAVSGTAADQLIGVFRLKH